MTIPPNLLLLGDTATADARDRLEQNLAPMGLTIVGVHAFPVGAADRVDYVTEIQEVCEALIAAPTLEATIYAPWVEDFGCLHKAIQLYFAASLVGVDVYIGGPPIVWHETLAGEGSEQFRSLLDDLTSVSHGLLAAAGSRLLLGEMSAALTSPSVAKRSHAQPQAREGMRSLNRHHVGRAVSRMTQAGMSDSSVADVLNSLHVSPLHGRNWTARRVGAFRDQPNPGAHRQARRHNH